MAVVGSPVAAVPGRARKAESPKLVSPGPEKPSITKVEEQKPSVKKNTVVSNTDVAEKEVVRKDVVKNKEAVSSKKVAVSNEVIASKSSNPPTNSVTSQQDDQRSVPQSITQSLPQVVPENHQQNSPSITPEQLFKLLAVLMSSYEAGDLERFVDLFAEDAGTTDGNGKPKIYKLYKEYFARPEQRKISITQFRWKDNGSNAKNGSGNVHLVTIPLDGSEPTNGGGPLRLDVQLYPEGLKIKGMYYKIKTK